MLLECFVNGVDAGKWFYDNFDRLSQEKIKLKLFSSKMNISFFFFTSQRKQNYNGHSKLTVLRL